ncbi:hypothetical protein [Jannaschia aquimarina]|uniref:Tat pathway signal sequence domain protein n=1 Tax=Jannaschia aquimarina TaxID=935700 RepID=A0A0D1CRY7_9RHOB|nr:hypothetical protein [Jannaschia aquimarina]KIT17567.1 hypothetical protein jaqu_07560 [Jannaschia aquimarina]SNS72657.1 hypothetical protein SAMN05421775_10250 [Jannaschia aquimarina]
MIRFPPVAHSDPFAAIAVASILVLSAAASPAARAQEAPASLSIELNALDQIENACRMIFVVRNGLGTDVDSLVVEAVAFDAEDAVARISLLDFAAVPASLSRVRQFDLPALSCDEVDRLMVNGVQTCEGVEACPLTVTSRTTVDILG